MAYARSVAAGSDQLIVESFDPAIIARIDHLLAALEPGQKHSTVMSVSIEPSSETAGDDDVATVGFRMIVDDSRSEFFVEFAEVERRLTRLVNTRKLDTEAHLLHLHSAAVARGSEAVLLVGRSGAGKSTLAAGLVTRGWDYVTDEQVTIRPGDRQILPYARPVTLRRNVWHLFAANPVVPDPRDDSVASSGVEVSPVDLGAIHSGCDLTPALIIAPQGSAGGDCEARPFDDVATTVMLLASSCYDSDRLGPKGLETLIGIARQCPGWHLDYHDLDDAGHQISLAFDRSAGHEPIAVRHRESQVTPDRGPGGTVFQAPDVHSWIFGDGSAVLFRPDSRQMTKLNEVEARMWELLDQPYPFEDLLLLADEPEVRARMRLWIGPLVDSGFLAMAPDIEP